MYQGSQTGSGTVHQTDRHDHPELHGRHAPLIDQKISRANSPRFPAQCPVQERSSRMTRHNLAHPLPTAEVALSSTDHPTGLVRTTDEHENNYDSFRSTPPAARRQGSSPECQDP